MMPKPVPNAIHLESTHEEDRRDSIRALYIITAIFLVLVGGLVWLGTASLHPDARAVRESDTYTVVVHPDRVKSVWGVEGKYQKDDSVEITAGDRVYTLDWMDRFEKRHKLNYLQLGEKLSEEPELTIVAESWKKRENIVALKGVNDTYLTLEEYNEWKASNYRWGIGLVAGFGSCFLIFYAIGLVIYIRRLQAANRDVAAEKEALQNRGSQEGETV